MKRSILTGLSFLTIVLPAFSQTVTPTVFSSNGGSFQGAQGSIAWTIGEPVSSTYVSAGNITTMGFQQPDIVLGTMLAEPGADKNLLVYPNPVKESVSVDFSGTEEGNYQLELFDALGKIIFMSNASISSANQKVSVNLNPYAAGEYFLVISNNNLNKTIKLNKVN